MRSYSKPLANKRWSYLMQLLTSDVPRRSTELPCVSVRVAVATTLRGVLKKSWLRGCCNKGAECCSAICACGSATDGQLR
jgi:hypothetical protein